MRSLFLAPHSDDETLFGAFTLLRHKPDVIICLRDGDEREGETARAMEILGIENWRFWPYEQTSPDWDGIRVSLESWLPGNAPPHQYERVFAPHYDFKANGHSETGVPPRGWGVMQHDMIGKIAHQLFGERYSPYCLYTRWGGRMKGVEIPFEPHWPALKLRALACYESQIVNATTATWFIDDPIREYVPA